MTDSLGRFTVDTDLMKTLRGGYVYLKPMLSKEFKPELEIQDYFPAIDSIRRKKSFDCSLINCTQRPKEEIYDAPVVSGDSTILLDEVVIARGDLGNAMPLWELPRCQKQLSAVCRSAGVPFMVVTQMLDSMCSRAVPTRAEVSDIYNAVADGASSVMLTGETAAGQYPVEAMEYLVRTARTALE